MEHASQPESYYGLDLWRESPITGDEREALRDEIRHLVLEIKEETNIGEIEHKAIGDISLRRLHDQDALTIETYLIPEELETAPVGDENFDEYGELIASEEAHYLRDIGHEWKALEYDLTSELVLMLDLPEMPSQLADYLLGGDEHGPCLFCTMTDPDMASFSITAHIPETTQRIYDNAEFELARHLEIPIDGSSK